MSSLFPEHLTATQAHNSYVHQISLKVSFGECHPLLIPVFFLIVCKDAQKHRLFFCEVS